MKETFHIAVILGSAREGRFCDTVANWVIENLRPEQDLSIEVIDPARLDLPATHAGADHPAVRSLHAALDRADAFVLVTPEYNHSFPGALKLLIDAAREQWKRKPLAFVSYGGVSGGLRAVEQLRLVFAELHVVTMRDVVSIANAWDLFDETGLPADAQNARNALLHMTEDLKWWARALRNARRMESDQPVRLAAAS